MFVNRRGKSLLALAASVLLLGGCGHGGTGGVVVLDLSAAAQATGEDQAIRAAAEQGARELMTQLETLAQNLDAQIAAEREKLGENPTEDAAARLQQLTAEARQQVAQAQQEAQQQADQLQTSLVVEFRAQLMPYAETIARQRDAQVILSKDAYVFWVTEKADITNAVVAAWQADNPPAADAEAAE